MSFTLKAIEIKQNKNILYLCKLDATFLKETCKTTIEDIQNNTDVFQRRLNRYRVSSISRFAMRNDALFPTSIVLNSNTDFEYNPITQTITFTDFPSFFIIDGQHRIAGIYETNPKLELPVVIIRHLEKDLQSELFVTINSEQKTVNPNVRFNIKGQDSVRTPEKEMYNLAIKLHVDTESPFYNLIRLSDRPQGGGRFLSLSALCQPLRDYVYDSHSYYYLKDFLKTNFDSPESFKSEEFKRLNIDTSRILWKFYANNKMFIVHKMLLNYFNAIKDVYNNVWNDSKSIIKRTTGFNAFIMLFKKFIETSSLHNNDFSYLYFKNTFAKGKISDSNFYIRGVENFNGTAGVGKIGAFSLYIELKKAVFPNNDMKTRSFDSSLINSIYDEEEDYAELDENNIVL